MLEVYTDGITRTEKVRRYEDNVLAFSNQTSANVSTGGQRSGSENPGWKAIIRRGGNATTNFSASEHVLRHAYISGELTVEKLTPTDKRRVHVYIGEVNSLGNPSSVPVPSSMTSLAETLAREQFLKKYRDARTAFQGGVFAGELLRTVRMIKSPAKALREGINSYYSTVKKRKRGAKGPSLRRVIGETWLEYVFGWRPLIRDVEDACRLGCASPSRFREPITSVGKVEEKTPERITRSAPFIGHPIWNEYFQRVRSVEVRYRGAADSVHSPPPFPEQLGFSWSNVLPTAWELVPFSFLVDYFSNVGRVIEGISTGVVTLSWGVRTQRVIRSNALRSCELHPNEYSNFGDRYVHGFVNGSGYIGHRKELTRTSVDAVGFGLNDLRFTIPGAGSLKWLNIAALATLRK